jgi:hypothetical protein
MVISFIFVVLFAGAVTMSAQRFTRMLPEQTGVSFSNVIVESEQFNIYTDFYAYNGGGVAIGDVNGDGRPDLFFTSTQHNNKLYLNRGEWRFEDVTSIAGLDSSRHASGVMMADLTGDGALDIVVCRRELPIEFWVNDASGSFSEQSVSRGLTITNFATQSYPIDYDRDGDLDLFVVNNGTARRHGYVNPGVNDLLYRNDGTGHFEDLTAAAGIKDRGYGLSASIGDVNDDGWPDIYVANDFEERDKLYLNNHDGTFTERITWALQHMTQFSMGSDIADLNDDGLLDIMVVDMLPQTHYRRNTQVGGMSIYGPFFDSTQRIHNQVHINRGNGRFTDVCYLAGLAATDWSWAVLAADFDLNGRTDVFIGNGTKRDLGDQDYTYSVTRTSHMKPDAYLGIPRARLPNYLFAGDTGIRFREVTKDAGLTDSVVTNGAAYGDLDGDGDLDLVLNNTDTVAFLYRNLAQEQSTGEHWARVALKGRAPNTWGIGARVTVHAGGRTWVRELQSARGYLSSVAPDVIIGIGKIGVIDSITVRWSNGTLSTVATPGVDRTVTIEQRPDGEQWVAKPTKTDTWLTRPRREKVFEYYHRENFYDDFKRERLLPYRFSNAGPGYAKGDVNGDGREDVVVTGAAYSGSRVYLQQPDGTFQSCESCLRSEEVGSEDVAAALFDIDGDKDLDLLIVTGGNEFYEDDPELQDELYLNDGKGTFTASKDSVPTGLQSGSCIAVADMDGDGDRDVFIGGRVIPGRFPMTPPSYLLRNEKGRLVDVTKKIAPGLESVGMVTSATWVDIDRDKDQDLVVVGEWMTPRIWRNDKGRFTDITATSGLAGLEGWWHTVVAFDADGDGDMDLVAGNNGTNCRYNASPAEPIEMIAKDLDDNGSIDQVISYVENGRRVPTRGRVALTGTIFTMNRSFPRYDAFANATVDEILKPFDTTSAMRYRATTYSNMLFRNERGVFTAEPLPDFAQIAPIYAVLPYDLDKDGDLDLICGGNNRGMDVDIIGYDASMGIVLENVDGHFRELPALRSGFAVHDDVRFIAPINRESGTLFLVGTNNSHVRTFVPAR